MENKSTKTHSHTPGILKDVWLKKQVPLPPMASNGFHGHILLKDVTDRKKELSNCTLPGFSLYPHLTIRVHRGLPHCLHCLLLP